MDKKNKPPQTIFCDESGFTGNNLLDADQPYFCYAAIALTHQQAQRQITQLKANCHFQGEELKSCNLIGSESGKRAIEKLIKSLKNHTLITVCEKKYALAGKMFEYIFEPVLASKSLLFYERDFHRFIATGLYLYFFSKSVGAESLAMEFQQMIRGKGVAPEDFWKTDALSGTPEFITDIRDFCIKNRSDLLRELDEVRQHPVSQDGVWI